MLRIGVDNLDGQLSVVSIFSELGVLERFGTWKNDVIGFWLGVSDMDNATGENSFTRHNLN